MRKPDFNDQDEINGLMSTSFLLLGLFMCILAPILPNKYMMLLFIILGGIKFLTGIIWLLCTATEGDYSLAFLFEDRHKDDNNKKQK